MTAQRRTKMRVTNMLPDMQYAMQQSQQALSVALQQISTGLRVNQLSDDPAASANLVVSLASSANVDQYTTNVSSLLNQLQTADSAISSVVTSLNGAITVGTSGANGTTSTANKQALVTQVQTTLASIIAQANTSSSGVYLFAGTASSNPPFVPASTSYVSAQGSTASPLASNTALTAGSVTTIRDASTGKTFSFTAPPGSTIATLSTAISAAAAAGTLSAGTTASFNGSGQLEIGTNSSSAGIVASSTDSALGTMTATPGTVVPDAYVYVGNDNLNKVQVGDSTLVTANLPGDQLFVSGANVIGSLNGLITALQSGTSAQIGSATNAVSAALNNVSNMRIPLDNTINQLNSQETFLGQEKVTLSSQQTSLVGINLADAATNLSQAELGNNAVLAAAAKVIPQTLLDYLK
jgi:flagellar hook-associated protein 3 FlgL